METAALIVTIILILLGLAGTALPGLPGAELIYLGFVLYRLMTGSAELGAGFFIVEALAVVLIWAVDYAATALGTKRSGGGWQSAFGAMAGLVLATILLGPVGLLLGPFLGAAAVELVRGRNLKQALSVGLGTLLGLLGGLLFKYLTAAAMILGFFLAAF